MRNRVWASVGIGILLWGCSKSDEGEEGRGTESGGSATATGGARTGGATTGGRATGGRATGGVEAGGTATGGDEAAGADTGGVEAGGEAGSDAPQGGTATGGAVTGGTGTGGNATAGDAGGPAELGGAPAGGGPPSGGALAGGGSAPEGGTITGGADPGGEAPGGAPTTGGTATGGMPGTGGAVSTAPCGADPGQLFDASHPWNQAIASAPLDDESAAIIAYLQANHTDGRRFRIDGPSDEPNSLYGITLLTATADTPRVAFTPTDDFWDPDCDPAPIPIVAGAAIEGETGYACESDGDCHLIVIDPIGCRLYEMWRANDAGDEFYGGCQAIWDLSAPYEETLRGDCCTSADAAGLPIAAHMFSADDIAAGEIRHAIRFILPNELMRERIYVRPATHSTEATSGPADAPPYGARLRLRADFDESGLKPAAQVVARALKEYGMILSDGGNLTFTAANDRFTTTKWADVDLMPGDLTSLSWTDFEVPELGPRYAWDESCSCDRTPITD